MILNWKKKFKKRILKQNLIIWRENATAFPSKFCIFKGSFVLQEAAFGSHLRRRSSFFASLIIPFVLSGSSDESHGTCRKAILNPRFSCQMYRRLKPDKGGHRHSPRCSWASLDDSQPSAVPGARALLFIYFQLQILYLWRRKWFSQICLSLLLPSGFCWRQSWKKVLLYYHFKCPLLLVII